MKHLNVFAAVILAVAVLLGAYAIGRLIRRSRMEKVEPQATIVVQPNDVATPQAAPADLPAPHRRPESTPEERAKLKAERAEKLEQMAALTDEEKLQLRDEWRQKLRSKHGEPGRVPRLTPKELETISQRLAEMPDEEKDAFLARVLGRKRPIRGGATTNVNELATDRAAGSGEAEPNEIEQN